MRFRPDPTFYPSPRLAMEGPPERLAYVTALDAGAALKRQGELRHDALTVVDLERLAPTDVVDADATRVATRIADNRHGNDAPLIVDDGRRRHGTEAVVDHGRRRGRVQDVAGALGQAGFAGRRQLLERFGDRQAPPP